jgi:hypothetical protein
MGQPGHAEQSVAQRLPYVGPILDGVVQREVPRSEQVLGIGGRVTEFPESR